MPTRTVVFKNDDPAPMGFKRYLKGECAEVLEYKARLSEGRWWNYKLRVSAPAGISSTVFVKSIEVTKV